MDMAKAILDANKVSVETHACDGVGHGISGDGLARMIDFIAAKLDGENKA